MKLLLALLAVVLLGVGVSACGGTSKNAGSATSSAAQTSRTPQDDNHISTYGHAAAEPDKREITALITRYYAAAATDNGAEACSLIYSPIAKSVPEDYGQAPGPPAVRGKTCAVVMSKIFKHTPSQSPADFATTEVTGIRLNPNGNKGFVQLSSKTMPTGEIFVQREGGSWRVGALIGRACADCAAG
jgi:hypothetical protein